MKTLSHSYTFLPEEYEATIMAEVKVLLKTLMENSHDYPGKKKKKLEKDYKTFRIHHPSNC